MTTLVLEGFNRRDKTRCNSGIDILIQQRKQKKKPLFLKCECFKGKWIAYIFSTCFLFVHQLSLALSSPLSWLYLSIVFFFFFQVKCFVSECAHLLFSSGNWSVNPSTSQVDPTGSHVGRGHRITTNPVINRVKGLVRGVTTSKHSLFVLVFFLFLYVKCFVVAVFSSRRHLSSSNESTDP